MNAIGFSTGALALGDYSRALRYLRDKPVNAIELSALRMPELPILLDAVSGLDLGQFQYVALHLPSSFSTQEELKIIDLLLRSPLDCNLVLHPDTIHHSARWAPLGERIVLENMDRRKPDGRTTDELSRWFDLLPEAKFCFDLAHAQQWDTTMTEAYLLIKRFADRLCQIHISQLDSASQHHPLSMSSVRAFSEISWLIPRGVPFIIESRVSPDEIDQEIEIVKRIVDRSVLNSIHALTA